MTGLSLLAAAALALAACGSTDTPAATGNATRSTSSSTGSQEPLEQAIAGMDAAVYAYGIIGANLSGAQQRRAETAIATLDRQRAVFEAALGHTVNEAAVAYALPGPVTDGASARSMAELIEMKLIPYFDAVARTSTGATQRAASTAASKAANRAQFWSADGTASPGATA